MSNPLVSVCVVTYNHEEYITQCIESLLKQKTNFDFEILIGEDDSKDQTREICKDFAKRFPLKIKLFLRDRKDVIFVEGKPTGRFNFIETMKSATGRFIALCDGDDYWIDEYKLQKQSDFLISNPEYNLISHNILGVRQSENFNYFHLTKKKEIKDYSFDDRDLMMSNHAFTSAVMFKNGIIKNYPDIYKTGTGGDRRLYLMLLQNGKGYFQNCFSSVYRIHNKGLSQKNRGGIQKEIARFEEQIVNALKWNKYYDKKYNSVIKNIISSNSLKICNRSLKTFNIKKLLIYSTFIDYTSSISQINKIVFKIFSKMSSMFDLTTKTKLIDTIKNEN